MEKEADDMAEDALIPAALWESSAARVNAAPMAVYELSQRAEVHMAVVAGQVRFEHNNCRLFSQFVVRGRLGVCMRGSELRWSRGDGIWLTRVGGCHEESWECDCVRTRLKNFALLVMDKCGGEIHEGWATLFGEEEPALVP